jgi:hypothetical protein
MHDPWGSGACTGRAAAAASARFSVRSCCAHMPGCLPAHPSAWLSSCSEFPGTFAITPEDGEAYNAYNDSYARRQGVTAVPKPSTWM